MYMKALAVVRAPAANAAHHGACVVVDTHHELSKLFTHLVGVGRCNVV